MTYSPDFLRPLIERVLKGEKAYKVARQNGIHEATLTKYVRLAMRDGHVPEQATHHISIRDRAPIEQPTHSIHKQLHGDIVLAIPDLHAPFEHPDALAFLVAVRDKYRPTKVICLGDEADFAAFSRYPQDPDGHSPGRELQLAIDHLTPIYLEFPNVLVCTSNHTVRPMKKAFLAGLPAAFWPTYSTLLNAPDGWMWKDYHIIDGVRYFHGEGRSGFNAHIQFLRGYKQSVVIGHIHSYAAVSHEGNLFAVNSGCLIDTSAYAFKYGKHFPIPVNLGCSVIHYGKRAEFIPMQLTDEGAWNGRL